MQKESLIKAKELIIKTLDNSDIKNIDKVELMLNLSLLLDESEYEENIKVLQKHSRRK